LIIDNYEKSIAWGGTFLKTTNAGKDWYNQITGSNKEFRSVFFTKSNSGYIVGQSGIILIINDSGGIGTTVSSSFSQKAKIYPNPSL